MRFIIRSIKELKVRQEVYRVGLISLVSAVIWIGFDLYRAYSQTSVPKVLQQQLRPLNPSINIEQLSQLEKRIRLSESQLNSFVPILPEGEAELVVVSEGASREATNAGEQSATQTENPKEATGSSELE
jgi:hypothetical protein